MIDWLKLRHTAWGQVYITFYRVDGDVRSINGWYVAFDGPELSDMYLTNKHPLGDESGDIITFSDYKGLR